MPSMEPAALDSDIRVYEDDLWVDDEMATWFNQ